MSSGNAMLRICIPIALPTPIVWVLLLRHEAHHVAPRQAREPP